MLPTQGQGASQSIEDAVGVPIANKISGTDIERNLLALPLPTWPVNQLSLMSSPD
jgi:hypothetical protein